MPTHADWCGSAVMRARYWSTSVRWLHFPAPLLTSASPLPPDVPLLRHRPVPSDNPNELFPHTLHAQHRRFGDPREMELYLTFLEPHRVRYMTTDGIVHDEYIEVKYEFTTIEGSIQLQSDIRTRDLVDWFDVDVVWSDTQRRTDSYGNIRGLGTIQRIKLWRDRYSTFHYLTFHANQQRRWKEYLLDDFDLELRQREDRHRRVQLGVRGARRGSASENVQGHRERRFSATSIFRRSNNNPSTNGNTASSSSQNALGIRYLGIQFSRNQNLQAGSDGTYQAPGCSVSVLLLFSSPDTALSGQHADQYKDYSRFLLQWNSAHVADAQFEATFPTNHVELPSPYINGYQEQGPRLVNGYSELPAPSPELMGSLPPVAEPPYDADSDETP